MKSSWSPSRVAGVLAVWLAFLCGLACVVTLPFVIAGQRTWKDAFPLTAPFWLPWGLLVLPVREMARRFAFGPTNRMQSFAVHFLSALVVVGFGQLASRQLPAHLGVPIVPPIRSELGLGRAPGTPAVSGRPLGRPLGRQSPFRVTLDLLLFGGAAALGNASAHQERARQRERQALELEARLAESRLQALRTQLNPHFLFNTLNTISSLVHSDPKATDDMIANLSALLRLSLETTDERVVPLRRELDSVRLYVDIERIRFGDRLEVVEEIDTEALSAQVPPMILQPLVENAVRHGIEPRPGPGTVRVIARLEDRHLRIDIEDDGVGLQGSGASGSGAGSRTERPSHGIGLSNTRARLVALYGDQRPWLRLREREGGGCRATLEIPIGEEPSDSRKPEFS